VESQPLLFKFGSGIGVQKAASSSLSNLSEAFDESPPQEKPAIRTNPLMLPPRPRQPFAGLANASRNASPSGHVRKNSNPMTRPRKQFRRSLSMFEHPEDVMNQERVATLPPIVDVEAPQVPQLPHHVSQDESNNLPRISKETLIEVLNGKFNHLYEKFVIVDCRFEYEYKGGHIDGAVNFNDKEQLSSQLFDVEPTSKALLIFHCEYSAHRAPIMAKFIRNKDRTVNAEQYPRLTYPETYILDGGYSSFFKDYRSRCFPQNYVEMDAQEHARACEMGLGKVKGRSKLMRAQTFAFGQHSPSMEDSPTGPSRTRHDSAMELDFAFDKQVELNVRPNYDPPSFRSRRMFSY
jgi:M-phase inducer tyrosine phosphatase